MSDIRIPWHRLTDDERADLELIADRAVGMTLSDEEKDVEMDVGATHLLIPLDLQKLLDFDDQNFIHDVVGIRNCLDRENFQMLHHFLPRCHA